jgi:hypothetical protein
MQKGFLKCCMNHKKYTSIYWRIYFKYYLPIYKLRDIRMKYRKNYVFFFKSNKMNTAYIQLVDICSTCLFFFKVHLPMPEDFLS